LNINEIGDPTAFSVQVSTRRSPFVKQYRKRLFGAVLALIAACASATSAEAGSFLSGFTGSANITYPNSPADRAYVSFAVYSNNDGGAALATSLGTTTTALASAGMNLSARYVYLYQVVNVGTEALSFLQIDSKPTLYSSHGQIANTVFSDGTGASNRVVGTANGGKNFLGSESGPSTIFGSGPNASHTYTGQNAAFASASGGVSSSGFTQSNLNGYVRYNYSNGGDPTLLTNGYGYLLFLTSDNAPTLGDGAIHDNFQSDGYVPMASAPEPGSMALMSMAVLGLSGWTAWRRKYRRAAVA